MEDKVVVQATIKNWPKFNEIIYPAELLRKNPVSDPWKRVDEKSIEDLYGKLKPAVSGNIGDSTTSEMCWTLLPFYDSAALIRVFDPYWKDNDLVIYFLTVNGNLFRLNGKTETIFEVNRKAPILLNTRNVIDYLKFYCFFNRPPGYEVFYIIENTDEPMLYSLKGRPAQSKIDSVIKKPKVRDVIGGYKYICTANVWYKNQLHKAQFSVLSSGDVSMEDSAVILDDIPNCITGRIV